MYPKRYFVVPVSLVARHEYEYAPSIGSRDGSNLKLLIRQPVFGDVRSSPSPTPLMYSELGASPEPSRTTVNM